MQTTGRMVFAMTLLAAATPFVLPRVIAPGPAAGNPHPAVVGNAHPANFGNPHPADFGNPHPADFGDPHPALTAEVNPAFSNERTRDFEENVTIDPSHVNGNVTFAFPHAAHVTIVLPDGVQFAVNDSRNDGRNDGHGSDHHQHIATGESNWPGFAPLVPPVLQNEFTPNPGAAVITGNRSGQGNQPFGSALITNQSQNPFNEAAGAQPRVPTHKGQR
jgi:hypothetical protein